MNPMFYGMVILLCWATAGVGWSQNTINNGVAAVVNSEAITFREVLAQTQMEEDDLRVQQQAGKLQMTKGNRELGVDEKQFSIR